MVLDTFVMLLVGALGLLAVVAIVGILTTLRKTASPTVQGVIDALRPYALKAIYIAENTALTAMKNAGIELDGVDKKALADSLYAMIPDTIHIGLIYVPISVVKILVTQAAWEKLVQDEFDRAQVLDLSAESYLQKQVDAFTAGQMLPPAKALPPNGSISVTPTGTAMITTPIGDKG